MERMIRAAFIVFATVAVIGCASTETAKVDSKGTKLAEHKRAMDEYKRRRIEQEQVELRSEGEKNQAVRQGDPGYSPFNTTPR